MADVSTDVELGEVALILALVGLGGYALYKVAGSIGDYFKDSLDVTSVGKIPGVTGATQKQACAPKIASENLPAGGSTIWSCGSDFDYAKECGDVVQVRHSFWGQLWGTPVTYKTIPRDSYVRPSGGVVNPQFACCYAIEAPASARGGTPCCGGKQTPKCSTPGCAFCEEVSTGAFG